MLNLARFILALVRIQEQMHLFRRALNSNDTKQIVKWNGTKKGIQLGLDASESSAQLMSC